MSLEEEVRVIGIFGASIQVGLHRALGSAFLPWQNRPFDLQRKVPHQFHKGYNLHNMQSRHLLDSSQCFVIPILHLH